MFVFCYSSYFFFLCHGITPLINKFLHDVWYKNFRLIFFLKILCQKCATKMYVFQVCQKKQQGQYMTVIYDSHILRFFHEICFFLNGPLKT